MKVSDLPSQLNVVPELADKPDHLLLRGGSAIIGPSGRYIVEPVFDEDTILSAELDFSEIDKEQMTLDVSGHYDRPDLFRVETKKQGQP